MTLPFALNAKSFKIVYLSWEVYSRGFRTLRNPPLQFISANPKGKRGLLIL
jgi:hypothetical protein